MNNCHEIIILFILLILAMIDTDWYTLQYKTRMEISISCKGQKIMVVQMVNNANHETFIYNI